MNRKSLIVGLCAAVFLGLVGYGLYSAGMSAGRRGPMSAPGPHAPGSQGQKAGDIDPQTGKRILYWHDPMVPTQRFNHPGKSAFMNMQLVPVEEGADENGAVEISSRVQQNLGVRTAEVTRGTLEQEIAATAAVGYDERDVVLVPARANGFIERLHARAPLDPVRKGQPLAELYVPDWVAAQEEYLAVKGLKSPGAADLLEGARQRMRLAGMTDELIRTFETGGKVQSHFTVTAPMAGVIAELSAREGMAVMNGAPLFRINGLATVWINVEVPETFGAQVRPGDAVKARVPALPGTVFDGKVDTVLPHVDLATRTLTARVELANPDVQLVPGMFVTVQFANGRRRDVLLVPSEAVIETGTRRVVILAEGEGRFRPVNVEIGSEGGGKTEIRSGLTAGQTIVVSGQFLLDSEASLKGTEERLQ
jgi:membrane fusion protein, copper/silver efflux system